MLSVVKIVVLLKIGGNINMNKQKSIPETILELVPVFYNLAITSIALSGIIEPMMKAWGKDMQRDIRNLRKRGIAVVEIRDRGTIETYHPIKGVENMLNEFVEKNDKWKLEKEVYGGVKTGKYILTRVYRKYYKNRDYEEDDCCECCGRAD